MDLMVPRREAHPFARQGKWHISLFQGDGKPQPPPPPPPPNTPTPHPTHPPPPPQPPPTPPPTPHPPPTFFPQTLVPILTRLPSEVHENTSLPFFGLHGWVFSPPQDGPTDRLLSRFPVKGGPSTPVLVPLASSNAFHKSRFLVPLFLR